MAFISEICTIRSGKSFSKKPVHSDKGDYLLLESAHLNAAGEIDFDSLLCISSRHFPRSKVPLQQNEVLIRAKGTVHEAILFNYDVRKMPIFPTTYFLVLSISNQKAVIPEFLAWYLNQPDVLKQLDELAGGSTIKHLTKARLSKLQVSIPNINRQQTLLTLNKLIQKERLLKSEIERLKNQYYQQTFHTLLEVF